MTSLRPRDTKSVVSFRGFFSRVCFSSFRSLVRFRFVVRWFWFFCCFCPCSCSFLSFALVVRRVLFVGGSCCGGASVVLSASFSFGSSVVRCCSFFPCRSSASCGCSGLVACRCLLLALSLLCRFFLGVSSRAFFLLCSFSFFCSSRFCSLPSCGWSGVVSWLLFLAAACVVSFVLWLGCLVRFCFPWSCCCLCLPCLSFGRCCGLGSSWRLLCLWLCLVCLGARRALTCFCWGFVPFFR